MSLRDLLEACAVALPACALVVLVATRGDLARARRMRRREVMRLWGASLWSRAAGHGHATPVVALRGTVAGPPDTRMRSPS